MSVEELLDNNHFISQHQYQLSHLHNSHESHDSHYFNDFKYIWKNNDWDSQWTHS